MIQGSDLGEHDWLVVSTHLKNISQNGNLPQIGVKIKNIWKHHLDAYLKIFEITWLEFEDKTNGEDEYVLVGFGVDWGFDLKANWGHPIPIECPWFIGVSLLS